MKITVKEAYHPIMETLGLLYLRRNFSKMKGEILKGLSDLESDGAGFYREHFGFWEDYVNSFGARYVPASCEAFFLGNDTEFFLTVLQLFLEDPELIAAVGALGDEELRLRLSPLLAPDGRAWPLESTAERLALVSAAELSEQSKWNLLLLLEAPQARLVEWAALYRSNQSGWLYAKEQNQAVLEKLRRETMNGVSPGVEAILPEVAEGPVTVYPMAVFPLSEWVLSRTVFQGVLSERLAVYRQGLSSAREALPALLKCLGDKSKFEILCSLKERGKYNLELAEDVGLSPATVSHHMGMLLTNQLVSVEKRGGKVYYQLNPGPIREMLRGIEDILL